MKPSNSTTIDRLRAGRKGKTKPGPSTPRRQASRAKKQQASARHSSLVKATRDRLAFEHDLVIWPLRQYAGPPRNGSHPVFWGLVPGASDLLGVLEFEAVRRNLDCGGYLQRYRIGRFIALEAKTGKGKQTKEQREFEAKIRSVNGFYATFRSVAEAVDAIKRARNGETS